MWRKAILAIAVLLVAACEKAPDTPTVQEYLARSSLAGKSHLKVGVLTDVPLMSELKSGQWSGFDIELARFLGGRLGFEPQRIDFVPLSVHDRIPALETGSVDLVIAGFSITDERQKYVRFAGPYLVTGLELLVRQEDRERLSSLDSLRGKTVCALMGSTSEAAMVSYAKVVSMHSGPDCIQGVLDRRFDGYVSNEYVVAGIAHTSGGRLAFTSLGLGKLERLGIGVPKRDVYLQALIQHFLQDSYEAGSAGRWQVAFDATLGKSGIKATQPRPDAVTELRDDPRR